MRVRKGNAALNQHSLLSCNPLSLQVPSEGLQVDQKLSSCCYYIIWIYMGVSINGGTPIAGWFIMENPINKYDLGGAPFQETSIQ